MMKLALKTRIALYFAAATAAVAGLVLLVIYFSVQLAVYSHLDGDIRYEMNKHRSELREVAGKLEFRDYKEWLEREHRNVEVNPVFVQVIDGNGQLVDRSPNLKDQILVFDNKSPENEPFSSSLVNRPIRQIQREVRINEQIFGHILVAIPMEDAEMVLGRLKTILLIIYPITMLLLFVAARSIVGTSIKPVTDVIVTAKNISKANLFERIPEPKREDELHLMVVTINGLLDRIGKLLMNERDFTASVSHELRSPLAVIKGTLEVLLRKPRPAESYEAPLQSVLGEVNRLDKLVDQLLAMARAESEKDALHFEWIQTSTLFSAIRTHFLDRIQEKDQRIEFKGNLETQIYADPALLEMAVFNLVDNAVKYVPQGGNIEMAVNRLGDETILSVTDDGPGITLQSAEEIFKAFYRDADQAKKVKGNGLGLSIVERIAHVLDAKVEMMTKEGNEGFGIQLIFNKKNSRNKAIHLSGKN